MKIEEFKGLPKGSLCLIDIRNDESFGYGTIPGAYHIPGNVMEELLDQYAIDPYEDETESKDLETKEKESAETEKTKAKEKKQETLKRALQQFGNITDEDMAKPLLIFCARGEQSERPAERITESGIEATSLEGGYNRWLIATMKEENEGPSVSDRQREVELSIMKKFHKQLFTPFAKAINTYELLKPGDKVAVCISGGKDSFLMAKLFQELKRHNKFEFELKFIVMDPGYSDVNRQVIENNAKMLGIPIEIHNSDIFDSVVNVEKSPCYLCARMRRGNLYAMAKEAGCNKIALGHHYDDVIETILMGMLYGAQVQTMMPKIHSTNFEGMELIRPLYLIREDDIKKWRDDNGLHFIQCACRFTDTCSTFDPEGHTFSKRMEIKHLIADMKKINPFVESNIFRSVENVNLSTVVAYKENGVKHSFLEWYDAWDETKTEE